MAGAHSHVSFYSAASPLLKTTSVLLRIPPPAVDIVATDGGVAAVASIAVAVPLVVPAIDLGGAEGGALV